MNNTLLTILKKANKSTVQALVRDFSVERLGYIHCEVIEDDFNIKRGTCGFGIVVSELFSEFKVDKVRLHELEPLMRSARVKAKNSFSKDVILENMNTYNELVEEFNKLNDPITKFVKLYNKILKSK